MDMPIPTPSPYSDDSEGPVLRTFVDESIAQQRQQSPRSQHLAQTFQPLAAPIDPGPSRQRDQIPYEPPTSSQDLVADTDGSANELLRLITKQKQEIRSLRKALHVAKDHADSEAQRLISLERTKTTEHFRLLNENRLAAQQDAMKAGSELRLYQFQLENAQKEISKAQDLLRTVQDQRDDAEEAAARARRKARKYLQERMVAAAREEGRRIGFEAGLRRAQDEQAVYSPQRRGRAKSGRKRLEPGRAASTSQVPDTIPDPITQEELFNAALGADVDLLLSPRLEHLDRRQNASPVDTRSERIPESRPPLATFPPTQPPEATDEEVYEYDSPPPPEPVPISYPTPVPAQPPPRSKTPSLLAYPIAIPPASEIERQNSLNERPGKHSQQWVTADRHHELTGQEVTSGFQPNYAGHVDMPRGGDISSGRLSKSGGRKGSLYRTLTRPFRWRRKPLPFQDGPNVYTRADPSARSTSWYTPAPASHPHQSAPPPPVHVRDFGVPPPKQPSAADSVSVSTRMSQLELVSPPPDGGSETSLRLGAKGGRRRYKEKVPLHVINEDLDGRASTPMKQYQMAPESYSSDARLPQVTVTPSVGNNSPYSNPKVMNDWRKSSASVPREMNDPVTPRGPRRPAYLTVPAPLAPDSAGPYPSQSSGDSGGNPPPLYRRGTSSEISPIGISVVGPSRSPSDAPASSHLENNFLSPNRILSDLPSLGGLPESPSPSGPRPSSSTHEAPVLHHQPVPPHNDGWPTSLGLSPNRSGSVADETNVTSQLLPTNRQPAPENQWSNNEYTNRPPSSRLTPKSANQQALPYVSSGGSVGQQTPRHSVRNLPATSGGWGGTARSDGSHRRAASDTHGTPTQTPRHSVRNLPLASVSRGGGGGWGESARSDRSHKRAVSETHQTPTQTPRHSVRNLPPPTSGSAGGWGGVARSDGSHKRAGSETHFTPGRNHATLPPDDEQAIRRVGSNVSMRSQYAKFDGSSYVDPAFYKSVEDFEPSHKLDKGKGVERPRSRLSDASSTRRR